VDIWVKTFVPDVARRLDLLCAEYGFKGPKVVPSETGVYYPLLRTVRYKRTRLVLEISLVLSYMGEEYAATHSCPRTIPDQSAARRSVSSTARTGYQMRRALDRQAEAARRMLYERIQPHTD
jgi:hypothetical protein